MSILYTGSAGASLSRRGRPPVQREAILADLRQQIADGVLGPGDRLPSRQALIERYGASLVTVQRAMKVLEQEGCIRSVPGQGRFVTQTPPARYRFALVFPGYPEPIQSARWTRLFAAQLAAAAQVNEGGTFQWEPWFDFNLAEDGSSSPAQDRLCEAVQQRQLAGLLFAGGPHGLEASPLSRQANVPMMALAPLPTRVKAAPSVSLDAGSFASLVVDHLLHMGRQRVAWLTPPQFSVEMILEEVQQVERGGDVAIRREWVSFADPYHPDWLEHALGVLMNAPARRRPEAIVVRDDHLLEPALRALAALGVRVPEDVAVVSHWNFPLAPEFDVPVHLVGFDAVEQLKRVGEQLAAGTAEPITIAACTAATFHQRGGRSVALPDTRDAQSPSSIPSNGGRYAQAQDS